MQVPFYRHGLRPDLSQDVARVLAQPILTSGAACLEAAGELCRFFGIAHAHMTNSWTNGAIATLLALDIGPGDEVIVPAMTFAATANAVEVIGARAVFVDVEPDTLLIDIAKAAAAVTPATRAVIPVHLYGQMVDVAALRAAFARRSDIAIIEDAAHCFEGDFHGAPPGAHSDAAIFSFYATKNVTCGEGGAIITSRGELFEKISRTVMQGMSAGAADRFKAGQYRHWDMVRLGTKANLSDLLACLLPEQIRTVRARLGLRAELARRYERAFAGTAIGIARVRPGVTSARHLFAIHVPPHLRDRAIAALNARGIGVTVNYRSVPELSYYRAKFAGTPETAFPVASRWGAGTLSLPLFPGLAEAEQHYVIGAVLGDVVALIEGAGAPAP